MSETKDITWEQVKDLVKKWNKTEKEVEVDMSVTKEEPSSSQDSLINVEESKESQEEDSSDEPKEQETESKEEVKDTPISTPVIKEKSELHWVTVLNTILLIVVIALLVVILRSLPSA
jgi:hypothetical protein